LRIENALLREKLSKADQNSPYRGTVGQPLIVPELLQASVLGEETAKLWRAGKFIDKGTMDGVGKSALVLDDTSLLIDQGRDENLLSGQPVYSGRRVFGKVVQVGRWVSTVAKVTDARYRGWAQLGRRTSQGLLFEGTGILEGRGEPLCRLELVKLRELVSVGDEVYTANRDSTLPYPMYYGKVVQVKPGTQFWEIWVKPAVNETNLQTVQVLRKKFNPIRMLGE
jgi:cell shape-determining protein MreC